MPGDFYLSSLVFQGMGEQKLQVINNRRRGGLWKPDFLSLLWRLVGPPNIIASLGVLTYQTVSVMGMPIVIHKLTLAIVTNLASVRTRRLGRSANAGKEVARWT